jgi:hypothetical protein
MAKNQSYQIVRITLISLLLLDMILTIIGFTILYKHLNSKPDNEVVVISLLPSLLFILFLTISGIIGAVFNIFSVTITFAIIKLVIFISSLNAPFNYHHIWDALMTVFEIIISFALALNMIRSNNNNDRRHMTSTV